MNNVNLIGRLVADPELRKTESGTSVCNFRLAVDDTFSKEDRADFLNITAFGNQGSLCEKYLRKGFICGVSGSLRSDSYTDKEGVRRTPVTVTAERVQFLQWPERVQQKSEPEHGFDR